MIASTRTCASCRSRPSPSSARGRSRSASASTAAVSSALELTLTRVFDAPRELVFAAWTRSEHAKRELLPWDGWGVMADAHESDAHELALLDRVAALTLAGDEQHAERLALQSSDTGLRVPRAVINFNLGGAEVELPPGIAND